MDNKFSRNMPKYGHIISAGQLTKAALLINSKAPLAFRQEMYALKVVLF